MRLLRILAWFLAVTCALATGMARAEPKNQWIEYGHGATGAPLAANIAIHGSFRDHEPGWAKNAKGMFVILHGAEDKGYPLTTVNRVIRELRANARSIESTARTLKEVFGI